MYSDYTYYTGTFLGDLIPEERFPVFAARADVFLEELTMGRCADARLPEASVTAVKQAECAAAEELFRLDAALAEAGDASVEQEKVGDYAVTRRRGEDLTREAEARVRRVIRRYLVNTGLLFRGIPIGRCRP